MTNVLVDSAGRLITTPGPTWTTSTIPVDTELLLAADNVTISNVKTFVDSTGTQTFARVTSGSLIMLDPSSTIAVVSSIASTIGAAVEFPTTSTLGAAVEFVSANTTVTTAALNVTETAATIPANATRKYLLLKNLGAQTVLLKHGATASTTAYDFFMKTDDGIEYNQTNLWTGYISYIASTLTSTMTVLEW